jgi:hypothetical protein
VEPERAAVASAVMSETRAAARRRETAKEERPDRPCDTTIQYNTIQYNTRQDNTIQYNTEQ